jgi:anti-anti-sigma factor
MFPGLTGRGDAMYGHPAGPQPDGVVGLQVALDLGAGLVRVSGELDRAGAHQLLDAFLALDRTDHLTWTVDVAGITFCDAEGLRVLSRGHDLTVTRERQMRLLNATPLLRRLMCVVGLSSLMENGAAPGRSRAECAAPTRPRRPEAAGDRPR